jgi:hypothetical protein
MLPTHPNEREKITSASEVHMACSGTHRTFWSVAVAVCAAVALSPAQVSAQIVEESKPVAAAAPPEAAQPAAPTATAMATPAAEASQGKPYYIEFRARSAQSYGHTFSIYGRLNANGQIVSKTVSGLHPATESPVPWMIGHFVLVPSETGASDGDKEDQYVTARFRMNLSADEYKKVHGYQESGGEVAGLARGALQLQRICRRYRQVHGHGGAVLHNADAGRLHQRAAAAEYQQEGPYRHAKERGVRRPASRRSVAVGSARKSGCAGRGEARRD